MLARSDPPFVLCLSLLLSPPPSPLSGVCITHPCFDSAKLVQLMIHIEDGYRPNPYHNNIHAADVTQTVYFFLNSALLTPLPPLYKLAAVFAAAIHDYAHPGTNNNFQVSVGVVEPKEKN